MAKKAVNKWKDELKQETFASDEDFWEVASQTSL